MEGSDLDELFVVGIQVNVKGSKPRSTHPSMLNYISYQIECYFY
ncbi:hypothetical protein [Borreliella garinii]|nr:hypothetical protein [Borreliella garinii]